MAQIPMGQLGSGLQFFVRGMEDLTRQQLESGGRSGIGGIDPGTISDPTTGRQFTDGAPTSQDLETTQAYQRALSAAGVRDPNLISAFNVAGAPQAQTNALAATSGDIVSNLPPLRGTAGGESRIDPTLRPYLGMGLQRAEQLFFGQPQPQLFPGQMYVSPSQQTLDALQAQEQLARAGSPQLAAAQEAYGRSLGQTGFTAGGGFLGTNPFLQGAIASATRPVMQQFQEQTLPGIQSAFSAAGRYGSGAQTRAIGQAQEAASRAIGDISASMTAQDYARERALMQQSIGQQAVLGQMAPSFFAQQFLPSEQLAQIGASREAIAAKPLQEEISRFQFQQQLPYSQLQSYLSAVYGNPMAASAVPQQAPAQSNRLGTALGGAALGAGIGQMVGGNYGGFSSPLIGAGLGGLAGLLF